MISENYFMGDAWKDRVCLFSFVSNRSPQPSANLEDEYDVPIYDGHYHDSKPTNPLSVVSQDDDPSYVHLNGEDTTSALVLDCLVANEKEVDAEVKIRSKPVPNGNWDVEDPLGWANDFGRRSKDDDERLKTLVHLKPGDEGYFETDPNESYPGITVVRTKEQARIVLSKLNEAGRSVFHACDTEVMDIDLKAVGPVGNGFITCVSIYSGPRFDYGLGDGPGSVLWIDNLDDAFGVLGEFKSWFENEKHMKVWHNYGFDRHVMWNEGIDVKGFGGDTMHMARLQDTSRTRAGNGYGLAALTAELLEDESALKTSMKDLFGVPRLRKDGTEGSLVDIPPVEVMQRDPNHRKKWIEYSCKDAKATWQIREKLQQELQCEHWPEGSEGSKKRTLWDYYFIHMRPFGEVLTDMERRGVRVDAHDYLASVEVQARKDRAYNCEQFRTWAQSMIGVDGLALNPASATQLQTFLFGGAKNQKTKEYTEKTRIFKVLREEIPKEALDAYKQKDSWNGWEKETDDLDLMTSGQLKSLCKERGLKISGKKDDVKDRLRDHFLNPPGENEANEWNKMKVAELKALCKENNLKTSGRKAELIGRLRDHMPQPTFGNSREAKESKPSELDIYDSMTENDLRDALVARGMSRKGNRDELLQRLRRDLNYVDGMMKTSSPKHRDDFIALSDLLEEASKEGGSTISEILAEVKSKAQAEPKYVDVTVTSLGLEPIKYTANGAPSVTADVLRDLAGDPLANPPKYGTAYNCFGGGKEGHDACVALFSLCAIGSIDTMIANFLTSLQCLADEKSRVHCSLNLNTETGRLSSRRPNLQNQPALEKDKYKIRKAFQSSPGNRLIVADYGQLELRLLASMTGCKSMVDAFASGGDFHSRTALDMFDYVKEKVDAGDCLLEWDSAKGDTPKPLLKDLFASERRKAKTLNFSIAYGKTAHGLSQDWGVSREEAEAMLQAWYNARPEVKKWQANKKEIARSHGYTTTLMGRKRQLPDARGHNKKFLGHAERASINTPIQGGAADVAMMAMNKINNSAKLKRLGWILLLQVHDEVMLEGPEETAEEAFEEVLKCMQEPWVLGLPQTSVPLLVDGSYMYDNWYEAK